jgi:hypothetical protein
MGGMPFHLEKGPIFSTIEALYNDPVRLETLLHDLWSGKRLGEHGVITSPSMDSPNPLDANATPEKRLGSLFTKWFGEVDGPGTTQPKFGYDEQTDRLALTTGYWQQYYGDVRGIVAETLMRAGEVSLGVDRPNPVTPPVRTRHWPVEFFWKCGQPRFEGWVAWRQDPATGAGHVTVIFATPPTPDTVLARPGEGGPEVTTGALGNWQGMWVCSHENHEQYVLPTLMPSPSGQWWVPTYAVMITRGRGKVGTWAPLFKNGGPPPEAPVEFKMGSTTGGTS